MMSLRSVSQYLAVDRLSRTRKFVIGSGALIAVYLMFFGYSSTTSSVETFAVQKGDFIVDVVVPGELKAHRSVVVSVPGRIMRGTLQIVELVPEGTEVKKGDFLVKFDTAELENKLIEEEADLATELDELEELIAQQKADSVQRAGDLEIQRLTFEQNKIAFELAKFEPKNKQRQMEIDMQKAELTLKDRIENNDIKNREAANNIKRKLERVDRVRRDIADTQRQIDSATIYAPVSGLVVYQERPTGPGTKEKIKVGDSVWRSQRLIELPDLSEMLVTSAVNEVDISKIKQGQDVIVTLDANADLTFYGTVSGIAELARRESSELGNRIKVFDVEIALKNQDESLKPGMSATCRIITDRLENVAYIPLQAVFEDGEDTFVYLKDGRGFKKTPVAVGVHNSSYITVEDGVMPEQIVALRDPNKALEEVGTQQKEKPAASVQKAPPAASRKMAGRGYFRR